MRCQSAITALTLCAAYGGSITEISGGELVSEADKLVRNYPSDLSDILKDELLQFSAYPKSRVALDPSQQAIILSNDKVEEMFSNVNNALRIF